MCLQRAGGGGGGGGRAAGVRRGAALPDTQRHVGSRAGWDSWKSQQICV